MAIHELESVRREIIAKREFFGVQVVHVNFRTLSPPDKSQDRKFLADYLRSLKLNDISTQLQKLDCHSGLKQLIDILYKGLAHRSPVMPLRWAAELAAKFIAPFDDNETRCYSNYSSSGGQTGSFSQATFDKGIIFIDDKLVGLLVVEDED
jgi:hypothetical protein